MVDLFTEDLDHSDPHQYCIAAWKFEMTCLFTLDLNSQVGNVDTSSFFLIFEI